ncbi:hypothetical protein KC902_01600 [Candidatus Kaiserbacteria bacterium]|nr:hypothetical protein [Candidatus Kaiserbacteria bacterium]
MITTFSRHESNSPLVTRTRQETSSLDGTATPRGLAKVALNDLSMIIHFSLLIDLAQLDFAWSDASAKIERAERRARWRRGLVSEKSQNK